MITINPIKLTRVQTITFGVNKSDNNSRMGLMTLDKNSSNKINFEKDLYITRSADSVQSNPLKAIGYSFIKAYNILVTPKKHTNSVSDSNYIHVPFMA